MSTVYVAVDVQNIEVSSENYGQSVPIAALLERIKVEGYPVVLRAYADWVEPTIRERMPEYRAYGFELIQLMSDSRGKNSGDMMLAVDVIESLHSPDCPDVYVVVSGDGDFVPLAPKMRRKVKKFVAMGFRESSNSILRGLCDDFVYFEDLIADFEARRRTKHPIAVSEETEPEPEPEYTEPQETEEEETTDTVDQAEIEVQPPSVEHREPVRIQIQEYAQRIPEPDYTNIRETAAYYRRVLQEYKHVRVETYYYRKLLIERAWNYMDDRGGYVDLRDIYDDLLDYAFYNSYGIYPKGIEVILRTLYIARCFDIQGDIHPFSLDIRVCPGPGIDAQRALDMMNETYVRGMTMELPDIHLEADGVAHLLMDEVTPESREKAIEIIKRVKPFYDEPTTLGMAIDSALNEEPDED